MENIEGDARAKKTYAKRRKNDRSIEEGWLPAGPSAFEGSRGGERKERLGSRASARKEKLLHGGIGKFRCTTKEGKGEVEGYRRRA